MTERLAHAATEMTSQIAVDLDVDNTMNDHEVTGSLQLYTISGMIQTSDGTHEYRLLADSGSAGDAGVRLLPSNPDDPVSFDFAPQPSRKLVNNQCAGQRRAAGDHGRSVVATRRPAIPSLSSLCFCSRPRPCVPLQHMHLPEREPHAALPHGRGTHVLFVRSWLPL